MTKILVTFILSFLMIAGFAQNKVSKTPASQSAIDITVPDFADPSIQKFYEAYTDHIKKTVTAVRNKDEAAFKKLVQEGKPLEKKFQNYMSEKKDTPEDVKKKRAWNKQAMPYIQEILQSDFDKRL